MRAAALVLCLVAVTAPLASATFGLLKAGTAAAGLPLALPAATLGGGLAAVKVSPVCLLKCDSERLFCIAKNAKNKNKK